MIKTEHSTWSPEWDPSWHEIFRDFGYAAYEAQLLEQCLIQLLLIGEHEGLISIPNKKDVDLEVLLSGKTLGQLLHHFKQGDNSPEVEEWLDEALKARNYLSHSFYAWHMENLVDDSRHGIILEELKQIRFKIGNARNVMSQVRDQIVEQVSGLSLEDLRRLHAIFIRDDSQGWNSSSGGQD